MNPSFKTTRYVPLRGDQTLWSVLQAIEQLSCDRTLTSVWSQKLLSRTLLMLTGLWHPASGHFAAQRLVSVDRAGFSLSRTLLESTERWPSAFGDMTSQRPITSRHFHLGQMN